MDILMTAEAAYEAFLRETIREHLRLGTQDIAILAAGEGWQMVRLLLAKPDTTPLEPKSHLEIVIDGTAHRFPMKLSTSQGLRHDDLAIVIELKPATVQMSYDAYEAERPSI